MVAMTAAITMRIVGSVPPSVFLESVDDGGGCGVAVVEEVEVVKSGVLCIVPRDSLGVMLAWICADDGLVESVEE